MLCLSERLLSSSNLGLHTKALITEGIRRCVIAIFNVKPNQPYLLGLELGDQVGLGLLDPHDCLLADGHKGFNGLSSTLYLADRELDRPFTVIALDGLLDQLRAHVGPHIAVGAVDSRRTEVIGIALTTFATTQSIAQALTTPTTEHTALEVMAMMLWALPGRTLFIKPPLYAVKSILIDQRLMTTSKDLFVRRSALVDNPTGIERVAK